MNVTRDALQKAAAAVRRRAARQSVSEMTDAELEASIRRGPIWSTLSNPSVAPTPISDDELETCIRNCHIAKALGIEISR
jgi:hypothetical protein